MKAGITTLEKMCPLMATCRACRKAVFPGRKFCPYCRQDFLKSISGRSLA